MFQLVTGVIAIVLAALIAIMALFYGGSVFTDNSGKAMYSKYLNGGQQIQAAVQLFQSQNGYFPTGTSQQILNSLIDGDYLSQIPDGRWIIQEDKLVRELQTNDQCKAINVAANYDVTTLPAGMNGCPPCADSAYKNWPACSSPTQY
jgi:hypothetical protein